MRIQNINLLFTIKLFIIICLSSIFSLGKVHATDMVVQNTSLLAHNYHSHNSYNSYNTTINHFENWDNLEITADYDTYTKKLTYKAILKNASPAAERQANNYKNSLSITVSGKNYYQYFDYLASDNSLQAHVSKTLLSESSLDSRYYVKVKTFEDRRLVFEKTYVVKPSKNFYRTLSSYNSKNTHTSASSQQSVQKNTTTNNSSQEDDPIRAGEILAYRYIFKIEAQKHNTHDRISTLKKFMKILETVKYTHNSPVLIESMINTMQNRIYEYSSQ